MTFTHAQQVAVARRLRNIARLIDKELAAAGAPRMPWSLFTWGRNRGQYISNAGCEDVKKALTETLERLGAAARAAAGDRISMMAVPHHPPRRPIHHQSTAALIAHAAANATAAHPHSRSAMTHPLNTPGAGCHAAAPDDSAPGLCH